MGMEKVSVTSFTVTENSLVKGVTSNTESILTDRGFPFTLAGNETTPRSASSVDSTDSTFRSASKNVCLSVAKPNSSCTDCETEYIAILESSPVDPEANVKLLADSS